MPQFGTFNPQNSENTSNLFVFQETPVTSSKLNVWNGNIDAVIKLLQNVISIITSQSHDAVLIVGDNAPLQVTAASPEDLTVQINTGWAVIQTALTGIDQTVSLPFGGTFTAPVSNPRIDLIILRNSGELDVVTGTEAASPTTPGTPNESISLASVYFRVGSTKIFDTDQSTDAYITDARPILVLGRAHQHCTEHTPSESPDGVRINYSTHDVFRAGTLDVYVNGILQEKDSDYMEDANQQGYTFVSAPLSHYRIQHRYIVQYEV